MSKLSDRLAERMVERYNDNLSIRRKVDRSNNFFDALVIETEVIFNLDQIKGTEFYDNLVESIAERT